MSDNGCYRWAFSIDLGLDLPDPTIGGDVASDCRAGGSNVKRFNFQLERGESGERYHLQGRFQLVKRWRKRQAIRFLAVAAGVDEERVKLTHEVDELASMRYACKRETRVPGPASEVGPFGDPASLKRIREAEAEEEAEAGYDGADLAAIRGARRAWQRELEEFLRSDPDDRSIVWVHDNVGGTGKSKFVKWAVVEELAEYIPQGKAQNIASVVIQRGKARAYLVDVPRVTGTEERKADLFSALEQVKNGMVYSTIYGQDKRLLMPPPHVIVFSNAMPDLRLASMDRWKIYTVPAPDSPLVEVPPGEVARFIEPGPSEGSGAGAGATD